MKEYAIPFSKETKEKLNIYSFILKDWQKTINLVGNSTLENMWQRHFLDSAQLYSLLPKQEKGSVVYDVGSGAGFPGMVLAIMGREDIVLCESSKKKCTFLEEIKKQTHTKVIIDNIRAELLFPNTANTVIARAVKPLEGLLKIAEPLINRKGLCIFPKGANWEKELRRAEKFFYIDYDLVKSITSKESFIFVIKSIERKNAIKE
jgi:16S rRNA (guanine527-N7)-methyltransferase